ncbi:GT4 family glycosyltransferase PelF [Flavobacterium sp.]|jgi:glycosyltransferase involved in cell wall biosynthesis|uniref:GT4 family glycosyltransferase PelF n=1 Tax=Flavobacterium sp. TaxID=239 RepID=UPI0022C83C9B|nr:GT4 family glycosyltransferase PelF [Flavobacterium sp.]MCZ8145429.1 GT4 family glycosyltransferase PelF [Flavobacterium sp.]MCZ8366136.1 GT4 family glycosyltransferase PelF [Flavobacterium sp.]
MRNKHEVMLIMEGTYPFNGGGVSTWAHMLCNRVDNAEYTLYSINAQYEKKPKYTLSPNVKECIQVPLWAPMEPHELVNYGKKYYKSVVRKLKAEDAEIQNQFLPLFTELLEVIYAETQDPKALDKLFFALWNYFQKRDYKKTMTHPLVWDCYKRFSQQQIEKDGHYTATLQDLTIGMRWIYRFLLPISIPVKKATIAHLTLAGFPVIPALVLKYKYDTPLVVTEHGVFIRERLIAINQSEYSFFLKNLLIRFSEAITRLVYHKADRILSVNNFNKTWETTYGADPNKIEVIYNGIDSDVFVAKAKPAHRKDIPTVVAAARIFELKDILTMIRSCAVVKATIPNVEYWVYGDYDAVPEYTEECRALITALKLEKNFFLAGYHNAPHELFCEGDVSILTSISEGFPYTVLESMSCGIPVVATDVGGVTEALDSSCGRVCKPKDHIAIGNSVIELLQNEALRKQMGVAARQRVLDHFTIDTFISAYEKAYDAVMEAKFNNAIYLHQLVDEIAMEAS